MNLKPLLMALVAALSIKSASPPPQSVRPAPTPIVVEQENSHVLSLTPASGRKAPSYKEEDVSALARIVYWEARGESDKGQIAVANVVLNRVRDKRWPNTIQKVIAQKAQFTPYKNRNYFKVTIPEHFYDIATRAMQGEEAVPDDYFYFSVGKQKRYAADFIRIGNHYFGRDK